jgi:enoyl-CoA hydratase/carnithine racemase
VGIEAAYQDASDAIAYNFMQPEAIEGVAAFLEKRKPVWD